MPKFSAIKKCAVVAAFLASLVSCTTENNIREAIIGPDERRSAPASTNPAIWQPKAGSVFQIVLHHPLKDMSPKAPIYIIDLFDNPVSTIQKLHSLNRKVICYFSAGSYENWRPDAKKFVKADYKKPLDPMWVGEWWLDTRRASVRKIMKQRLLLAKNKGCDGVDPDNVDGYGNDTGFKMTETDGVNYMQFLGTEAHALGLAIGLKNAPAIVDRVVDFLQWEVNEQCVEYDQWGECDKFRPFIDAGKPVFHIEYPQENPPYSPATRASKCQRRPTKGFSTILKNIDLTDYYELC